MAIRKLEKIVRKLDKKEERVDKDYKEKRKQLINVIVGGEGVETPLKEMFDIIDEDTGEEVTRASLSKKPDEEVLALMSELLSELRKRI